MVRASARYGAFVLVVGAALALTPPAAAQTDAEVPSPEAAAAADADSAALFDFLESEVETVELASKRSQSVYDAPADVTLIRREYIESVQAANVAELLRRAPGVLVLDTTGGSYNVGLRGINRLANNYTLVMIDGRKVASFTLGYIPWSVLPVAPGDLERVEVLHGPGSTLYGADAVSGVVNFVTKRPLDYRGTEGQIAAGSFIVPDIDQDGEDFTRLTNSGGGYAAHSFANEAGNLGARLSAGFNLMPDWDGNPPTSAPEHGDFQYHVSLTGEYREGDTSVLLTLTHALAERELSFTAAADPLSYFTSEQVATVTAEQQNLADGLGNLKGRFTVRREETSAGNFREGRGIARLSPNTLYLQGSLQSDWNFWGGRNNLTVGVDAEYNQIDGFQGGLSPSAAYVAAVAQNELVILEQPRLLASVGVRSERVAFSEGDDEVIYRNFNPRGALVLNIDDRHAIRAVSATAFRTPSPFELFNIAPQDDGDPNIPDPNTLLPNLALTPSRSLTFELGYRGRLLDELTLNSTVFYQRVNDFIDISRSLNFPVKYENLFDADVVGASAELTYSAPNIGTIWGHYTYTRSENADGGARLRDWPTHNGGFGAQIPLDRGFRVSGQASIWSGISPEVISVVGGSSLGRLDDDVPAQAMVNLRVGRAMFDGKGELFLAFQNALSPFRERDNLRQYVSDTVEPIGGQVLLGLQFREVTDDQK